MYANDTQLYLSFKPVDFPAAQAKMEQCIAQIRQWLTQNYLKLNDDKTELIVIGQPTQLKKITHDLKITIGSSIVNAKSSVSNIGAVLDNGLRMDEHISTICRACNISLRSISKIRPCLTEDSANTLIHSFITCKLDNLNSLLIGFSENRLYCLQLILNHAARIITKTRKYDHISDVLKALHWLPITARIDYKVTLLVYKCLNCNGPSYLSDLLKMKVYSKYDTRYADDKLRLDDAKKQKMRLKTMGDRAFSVYAPVAWNKLPLSLRSLSSLESFKKKLKTHFFTLSYG